MLTIRHVEMVCQEAGRLKSDNKLERGQGSLRDISRKISKLRCKYPLVLSDPFSYQLGYGSQAFQEGVGNCMEMSLVSVFLLQRKFPHLHYAIVATQNNEHLFAVIHPPRPFKGNQYLNFYNWPSTTIICDPWMGIVSYPYNYQTAWIKRTNEFQSGQTVLLQDGQPIDYRKWRELVFLPFRRITGSSV